MGPDVRGITSGPAHARGLGMLDHLQQGRAACERRAWSDAWQSLRHADRTTPLDAGDLERLATAAWLTGRDSEFQDLLDRLHRTHVNAGDRPRAARCAFWLSLSLLLKGDAGHANGWVARGQRLIEGCDCVEQGYLLLPLAEQQLREGRGEAAHDAAVRAAGTGERFADADLIAIARHVQGRALIQQSQVPAGLRLLDETMIAAIAGELSPIITGLMYCSVIESCREVCALSRAREWTFALSQWCEQQSEMVAFTGVCLVNRAEIMQFQGAWPDAMAEAFRACERARRLRRALPAAAFYRQGEIHRLRGERAAAEAAYRRASELGGDPQPGLALLRLAQGRHAAACAAMRRLVGATTDPTQRARLLPAHLEIMLATGDLQEARHACGELQQLATTFDADLLCAIAAQAHGAIDLVDGDARAALGPLRSAFEIWTRLDAPYEAARVRVLLGLACRALDDEDTGALEHAAARSTFERLGARPDLERLDALARRAALRREHPLTSRELHVLRLIAAGRTNKAIAAALRLSERTIDRHVSNILGKFDVPSRAAATAYAYDHGLL